MPATALSANLKPPALKALTSSIECARAAANARAFAATTLEPVENLMQERGCRCGGGMHRQFFSQRGGANKVTAIAVRHVVHFAGSPLVCYSRHHAMRFHVNYVERPHFPDCNLLAGTL